MDAWAQSARFGDKVAFVCVSCAGPQLAMQMGTRMRLQHCHNTWVDQDAMPTWGQLGCNGFIILDGSHNVVCRASRAFLQVKDAAFRHVETLLSALFEVQQKQKATETETAVDSSCGKGKEECPCASVKFGADAIDAIDAKEAEEPMANEKEPSKVASVKVAVLDEEHERCEAALTRLREKRSAEALKDVLSAYEDHFAHEEALLDEFLYADVHAIDNKKPKGFSADEGARTSHFADHEAMLVALRKLLAKPSVSVAEAKQLALDFERHATAYDGAYADRLSAAMADASAPVV